MAWTVAGVIRERAARDSEVVLLRQGQRAITAGELDASSSRVGSALAAWRCEPADRIAFLGKNSATYYEVLLGAAKIGAVSVGLNWRLSVPEIAHVISDAAAKVLFVDRDFAGLVAKLLQLLPNPIAVVTLDDNYDDWRDAHPAKDPGFEGCPSDIAVHLYTSGTTGTSKGVLLSNAAIGTSTALLERFSLDAEANALVNLPLFHFGGTVLPLWAWTAGGACVIHEQFEPALTVRQARDTVTMLLTVPSMLRMMCDAADADPGPTPALRRIGYGSAPITDSLLSRAMRAFECDFIQSYGTTETAGVITQLLPEEHDPDGPRRHLLRSVGRPIPGTEVFVGDARAGVEVLSGEVGPVWVRSQMNMTGYWNKPEMTAAVMTDDGWVRTGDLAYVKDGYLYLADRVDEMIITGGENVYPAEVENVVAAHSAVEDVAVVGVADERWGEKVTAVVVRRLGAELGEEEVIAFCRERIATYKAPRSVVFMDELPKNATGKVLRREIRDALSPERSA